MFPMRMPAAEIAKVTVPIKVIAGRIAAWRKARVTPTARASMLVAMARGSMALKEKGF